MRFAFTFLLVCLGCNVAIPASRIICDRVRLILSKGIPNSWGGIRLAIRDGLEAENNGKPVPEDAVDDAMIDRAIDALLIVSRDRVADKDTRDDIETGRNYYNLLTTTRLPSRSHHWMTKATQVVLELPKGDTLWGVLPEPGKHALMEKLSSMFQKGTLSAKAASNTLTRARMMKGAIQIREESPESVGLAPSLVLEGIDSDKIKLTVQVATASLVGVAAELGIGNCCIRILVGSNKSQNSAKLWVEYRISEDAPWFEIDSYTTKPPPTELAAILQRHYSLRRNPGAKGSNRLNFPDELKYADDLLTPTPPGEIGGKPFKSLEP